jgi:hypothetical protein
MEKDKVLQGLSTNSLLLKIATGSKRCQDRWQTLESIVRAEKADPESVAEL